MMDIATLATLLLDSALRASVILGVALGVAFVLRRHSAALRHLVLSLAVVGALLTPVMTLVAPAWQPGLVDRVVRSIQRANGGASAAVDASAAGDVATSEALRLPSSSSDAARASSATATGAASAMFAAVKKVLASNAGLIMTVWMAGVMVFAGVLLIGLARLRWLASRSRRVSCRNADARGDALAARVGELALARGVTRPVTLLWNDRARLLVTWGHFRPRIMLPADAARWSEERLRIVISHELAHVRRGDWSTQIATELLRAVFWFNPIVWIACRRLRAESELACDDDVLNGGVEGVDYAGHLLDLARVLNSPRHAWLSAPAMARPSSLEGRISAMLNARLNRHPVSGAVRAVTCALVIALTFAVAGFAQSTFYSFSGVVVDPAERSVAGVTLKLTNPSRGASYEVKSDANGRFEFVGLPSGDYGLEATREGFKAAKEIISIAGNVGNRRIALQVGTLRETISITGRGGPGTSSRRNGYDAATIAERRQQVLSGCKPGDATTGGDITAPMKLLDVRPIYPEGLSAANIGGTVTMDASIDTQGDVGEVIVSASPDPGLSTAAVEAVKQWQYTPTLLNCAPVDVRMTVTVTFTPKP